MSTVTIYGASDDLIEVEGDISEEFTADGPDFLAFSDGTVLSVGYGIDGTWSIRHRATGSASYVRTEADGPDEDNYSDRVTLVGDIHWVVHGTAFHKLKGATDVEA